MPASGSLSEGRCSERTVRHDPAPLTRIGPGGPAVAMSATCQHIQGLTGILRRWTANRSSTRWTMHSGGLKGLHILSVPFSACLFSTSAAVPKLAHNQRCWYRRTRKCGISSRTRAQTTVYNLIEDSEDVSKYCPGSFHPVSIGDTLKANRYRVIHKLGFGGYSTTWLALDTARHEYVAVKICSADSRGESREEEVLKQLSDSRQEDDSHPGRRLVPTLTDAFDVRGPNGHHKCLVMPPAMMSIRDAQEASYSRLFQPEIANYIVAQLILAVDFIHTKGIVHADIHPGNAFLRLPRGINELTPDELHEKYGKSELEQVTSMDGKALDYGVPCHLVIPIWLGKASEHVDMPDAELLLSDFGESFMPSSTDRRHSNSPPSFRPPEARFPFAPLGFPADIWSLACLIWEVLGQRPLFESSMATDDEVLADEVDLLGKLPPEWWSQWDARSAFYVEDGERDINLAPDRAPRTVRWGWNERLELCIQRPRREEGLKEMNEEKAALLSMLRAMLRFKPEQRITAKQLRQSSWMERWAPHQAKAA